MSGSLEQQRGARRHRSAFDGWADTPACICTTGVLPFPTGEILVLWVAGEVDLATLPVLQGALESSLGRRPAHLVVDIARVRYCSARGLSELVRGSVTAAERGVGFALSGLSPQLDRIWEKLWPGELPARYCTTATALATLHGATPAVPIRARQTQAAKYLARRPAADARSWPARVINDDSASPGVPTEHDGQLRSTEVLPPDVRPPNRLDETAPERDVAELRRRLRVWLGLDVSAQRPR